MASASAGPLVLVTGATGLLGRAVVAAFHQAPPTAAGPWKVIGSSFSRGGDDMVKCDLRDPAACASLISSVRPSFVVHAAAERRPDVCEKDSDGSEAINVDAVYALGRAAAKEGAGFLYVSTDYLFGGDDAPYAEDYNMAHARPLNAYGRLKLRGEHAALASHPHPILLRVPVLYGMTSDVAESAALVFARTVMESDKPCSIDDWQIRVPTHTGDIGATIERLGRAWVGAASTSSNSSDAAASSPAITREQLSGVFHYSSSERFTRWTLCCAFASLLGLPMDHITRDPNPPKGAPRPYDCQLKCERLEKLGLYVPCRPFLQGAREALKGLGLEVKGE